MAPAGGFPVEARLAGRVCVVTGAGRGIGRAIAAVLARDGGRVVVADRDPAAAEECARTLGAAGAQALAVTVDVTDGDAVEAMIAAAAARWGGLHVLVNNAGITEAGDPLAAGDAVWDRVHEVDVKAAWRCARAAVPAMTASGGSIVNVASIHALATAAGMSAYASAKAAMVGLTRALALDLAPRRVRVNAVCPGWTDTPAVRRGLAGHPDPAARRAEIERRHPMGRMGRPEEIAECVLFLASERSSFVTGTTLVADGGLLASAW